MIKAIKNWWRERCRRAAIAEYEQGLFEGLEDHIDSKVMQFYDYYGTDSKDVSYEMGYQEALALVRGGTELSSALIKIRELQHISQKQRMLLTKAVQALDKSTVNTSEAQYKKSMIDAPCHFYSNLGMEECGNCQRQLSAIRTRDKLHKYLRENARVSDYLR